MKLTSQEEYGLRCILTLAHPAANPPGTAFRVPNGLPASDLGSAPPPSSERPALTVTQIADREGISAEYTGKLMGVLVRAGLVESARGRYGGYRLQRPPHEITVAEALTALGGKLYDDDTCDRFAGDHSLCVHTGGCTIRSVWSGLQQIIDQVLTRTTLWDLIQQSENAMLERIRKQTDPPISFEVEDPVMIRHAREE